ncbi:hypothetical protein [Microtetraspora malaysiensis]|uniref:hypothetical protein n=1 Tax=Microtetraspora malaysiensis TaxID=161358 RepID=UPI0012FC9C60|nr:hypothetical protein [Microtetraspora malaysiensis]
MICSLGQNRSGRDRPRLRNDEMPMNSVKSRFGAMRDHGACRGMVRAGGWCVQGWCVLSTAIADRRVEACPGDVVGATVGRSRSWMNWEMSEIVVQIVQVVRVVQLFVLVERVNVVTQVGIVVASEQCRYLLKIHRKHPTRSLGWRFI